MLVNYLRFHLHNVDCCQMLLKLLIFACRLLSFVCQLLSVFMKVFRFVSNIVGFCYMLSLVNNCKILLFVYQLSSPAKLPGSCFPVFLFSTIRRENWIGKTGETLELGGRKQLVENS